MIHQVLEAKVAEVSKENISIQAEPHSIQWELERLRMVQPRLIYRYIIVDEVGEKIGYFKGKQYDAYFLNQEEYRNLEEVLKEIL